MAYHFKLKHHLAALSFALALGHCASAGADVRQVHLPYANGSVNVYVEARQCVLTIDGLMDRASVKAITDGFRQLKPSECTERIVVLNSPGGVPAIAYAIADLVRRFNFDTEVASRGLCASSCTYLFLGGRRRFVDQQSRIGIHQHSRDGACSATFTDVEEQRLRKLVDPAMTPANVNKLIELILSIDCKEMAFLSPEVLSQLTITNAAQSRISNAIRSAIEARTMQDIADLRATARGPWVRAAGNATLTVFTRPAAGPVAGGKPAIWGLVNHTTDHMHPQAAENYRSYEELNEADCENRTLAVILGVHTSEAMGEGRIIWKTGRLSPNPVKPNTPAAVYFRIACGQAVPG